MKNKDYNLKVKFANKETTLKSAIASSIITAIMQLALFIALYCVLKDTYITNEYLAIFLTMIGTISISELSVSVNLN